MDSSEDGQLIERILEGDTSHFAEVVRRFDLRVRSVVAAAVRDPDTREELVQQTFYLAFRNLASLQEPERMEGWLVRIARNCVAEHQRQHARQRSKLRQWLTRWRQREPRPDWIWDEVAALPESLREVLVLRYRANCTYKQIAARLGLPVSTVRGRIYEARRALRGRLCERGIEL